MRSIAVIGSGIGGLGSALALRRSALLRGEACSIKIYEKWVDPSVLTTVGAGFLIQPPGLFALREMGLLHDVLKTQSKVTHLLGISHVNKPVLDLPYKDMGGSNWFALGVNRGQLVLSMRNKLLEDEHISFIDGANVCAVNIDSGVVDHENDEGKKHQSEEHDIVIIATGARNALPIFKTGNRGVMSIEDRRTSVPYPFGALWCLVDTPASLLAEGSARTRLWNQYRGSRFMAGVMPTGINQSTVFWSEPAVKMDSMQQNMSDGEFQEYVQKQTPAIPTEVLEQVKLSSMAKALYNDVRMKDPAVGEKVVLLGDAAHGMSPQMGQGANMALTDAMTLGSVTTLQQYAQHRRGQTAFYGMASSALTPLFQSSYPMLGAIRDIAFPLADKIPYFHKETLRSLTGIKTGLFSAEDTTKYQEMYDAIERGEVQPSEYRCRGSNLGILPLLGGKSK